MLSIPVFEAPSISRTSTRRSSSNGPTELADIAWGRRRALGAIQGFSEDPGGRRLPDAARPGEQIGLGNTTGPDRVLKRLDERLVPDHLFKGLGPVLTGENLVGHVLPGCIGGGAFLPQKIQVNRPVPP